jgi:RNA polymerase sigma factor (sigma-70 family)
MPKHPKTANNDRLDDAGARARESFEELYKQHRSRFKKRGSRGISSDDAKDLEQDVLISVWLAQRVRRIRNFAGLVGRAFHNARVDRWRKQRARENYEEQFARESELLRAAPPGAESAALQDERERLLIRLSKEQPDAYRAYILRRYEELQLSEIAERMGIGRNRVSKLVRIALLTLHEAGGEEDNL